MPASSAEIATTVLVTGAMGQVGKRVTQLLLDRGRTVIALDLRNDATQAVSAALVPGTGTLIPAYVDLLDGAGLDALVALHRPDAIVHLAAAVAPSAYKNPRFARRVNVEGTANLVAAARKLEPPPLFAEASSSSVYGSRNPHHHADRLTALTPVNPVDCYGEDKVAAEQVVATSGLPHVALRLGGIISPDMLSTKGPEYDVMMRALPHDNRIHAVDCRDVALAFANAVDRSSTVDGKVLLIGGNESFVLIQSQLEDALMSAIGLGVVGRSGSFAGDPADDHGWGLTDWFDTTEAEQLLSFQQHDWSQTCSWIASSVPARQRTALKVLAPVIRVFMRLRRRLQNRRDRRGTYADPWGLMATTFGTEILAPTDWT